IDLASFDGSREVVNHETAEALAQYQNADVPAPLCKEYARRAYDRPRDRAAGRRRPTRFEPERFAERRVGITVWRRQPNAARQGHCTPVLQALPASVCGAQPLRARIG